MQSEAIIRTALNTDPTATPEQKARILNALNPEPSKAKDVPITTKEAAAILGCHVITLRRYEKEGLVKPIRYTARKIRWDRNEIERFNEQGVIGMAV